LIVGADSDTGIYAPSAGVIGFATNGSLAMTIDASNNVEINNVVGIGEAASKR